MLKGSSFEAHIDEQIVFEHLNGSTNAVWSLLLATGYLKVLHVEPINADDEHDALYTLALTNFEVKKLFRNMVKVGLKIALRQYTMNLSRRCS